MSRKEKLQQIESQIDELDGSGSPRRGEVETLDLRPGDILGMNAVAAKLLEPTELFVRIYVPETQLAFVHPHQVVPIFVDSFPGQAFQSGSGIDQQPGRVHPPQSPDPG